MYFFKRTMFYLNFLKDKYKVSYICSTPKNENHYRIHEELQTTLPKKNHLTPIARWSNSNRPKTRQHKRKVDTWGEYLVILLDYNFFFWGPYLEEAHSIGRFLHPKVRPWPVAEPDKKVWGGCHPAIKIN